MDEQGNPIAKPYLMSGYIGDHYSTHADTFELPSDTELRLFGFSDKDIEHVKEIASADIQIVDGKIDKTTIPMSNNADATGYGKFSAAAKIILKGWNKLPKWLRNNVEGNVAISTFLKWIENATGTLQKAIYNACRKAGMNPTVANLVASGIMLLF